MAHFHYARILALELAEEDERYQARLHRRRIRDITDPFSISDWEFTCNFRLNKDACLYLLRELEPYFNHGQYSTWIPQHLKLLSALHFFAMGTYQRSAGSCPWACLSQPMVSRAIRDVSNLIIRYMLKKWIKFPRNMEEKREISDRFRLRHRMPHVIGVIDGTHVALIKPKDNENAYVNRKGYHSINVQIICDEERKILSIVARHPGSSHDAFVWRNSTVGRMMKANFENGDDTYKLMGDSGYPCQPWMLTPLNNPQTREEIRFNNRFKSVRSVVERCIGSLKGRFRCLIKHRTLHYSPAKASKIVMTCAVLHNIATFYRVGDPEPIWDEMDVENPVPAPPQDAAADRRYRQLGQRSRQQYINNYF